jgi:hypothetical protein
MTGGEREGKGEQPLHIWLTLRDLSTHGIHRLTTHSVKAFHPSVGKDVNGGNIIKRADQ